MGEIARYAGCSRGTLYRYFGSRHALHMAFVNDRALRLVAELRVELRGVEDPATRLTEYVAGAVKKVRENPSMAAWFAPSESGMTARMSRGSEVIGCLADAFVSDLEGEGEVVGESDQRARWLVRGIVSLLTLPADSEAEERALIENFVVPSVLSRARRGPGVHAG